MRDYLLIYVNGRRYKISGKRGFQSLSDFLRYDLGYGWYQGGVCRRRLWFLYRTYRASPELSVAL